MSGGLSTVSLCNNGLSGDLMPLKAEAIPFFEKFSVECKNGYEEACPFQTITKTKGDTLKDFWTQACRDAFKGDKLPMLIFKKKGVRGNPFLGLTFEGITKYFPISLTYPYIIINFNSDLPSLYMMAFEPVFENTEYWVKDDQKFYEDIKED